MPDASPPPSTSLAWHRRYRTRLIAALFPVLAAVTVSSLWVAERRFIAFYRQVFETQFDSYLAAFNRNRLERSDALASKLREAAAHPAVIAYLQGDHNAPAPARLEEILGDLARQRLAAEMRFSTPTSLRRTDPGTERRTARPNGDPGPSVRSPLTPPPGTASPSPTFITLLDAEGEPVGDMLLPRNPTPSSQRPRSQERARQTRSFLKLRGQSFNEVLTSQQVGYKLLPSPGEKTEQVREIYLTPVRDADQRFLGALVFGLPMPALDERLLLRQSESAAQSPIRSGLWLEDQLVSSTIPPGAQNRLSEHLSAALAAPEASAAGDLTVEVDGQDHRVIYRILNPESPFEKAAQVNLYSLAPMETEIRDLRIMASRLAGGALILSLGLIYLVSGSLSKPVAALTHATRRLARRDYSVRVPLSSQDEMGQLATAFNAMASELALQDRYRSILDAVADPAVANRLIHDSQDLSGVLKEVSILFCDVRGFTALVEHWSPDQVIAHLNEHMTALTEVAYHHGGTVDKFVGDLIMVLFGAPETRPDDADRAVACARDMLRARASLNGTSDHPFEVGIGIATGPVVAGCMGSDKRLSYTVLGHHVNLASRLCSSAGAGQILIDTTTLQKLQQPLATTALPPLRLKGISDEIHVHAVHDQPAP